MCSGATGWLVPALNGSSRSRLPLPSRTRGAWVRSPEFRSDRTKEVAPRAIFELQLGTAPSLRNSEPERAVRSALSRTFAMVRLTASSTSLRLSRAAHAAADERRAGCSASIGGSTLLGAIAMPRSHIRLRWGDLVISDTASRHREEQNGEVSAFMIGGRCFAWWSKEQLTRLAERRQQERKAQEAAWSRMKAGLTRRVPDDDGPAAE